MKKTLAFLLALLLTFTMLPVSAFAAENPTFTVTSATGKAGDEVTVVVEIANNPGIWAYNYGIEYDTTRLEKVSYTGGGMDGGIWTINEKVLWESSTFENSTYNGETLVMKFKIKEDAPAGDAEIKIKDDFFACNCDGNIVNADLVAGKVTVEGKLETVIPLTKDNHDENSEIIRPDKFGNVGGLKIEGVKLVGWTQWKQGGNYQSQSITIYVAPESKDDIATLSLVLLNGQVGSGPLIDNPATVDVQLKDGVGSYWAGRMKIGTGGLAPQLNLDIYFKLACTEHDLADATCKAPKTCTVCGATEGEPNPDAHEWDEGKVTTEPTCSKAGVKTFTCKHNAQHTKTEEVVVDENAHDWDEGKVTTEPTCSEVGVKTFTCKHNAEHTYTEDVAIDENAHDWDEGKVTTEPTCSKVGVKTFTCKNNAEHTYTEDVAIKEDAHAWTVSYEWSDDGKACTATRVCGNNEEHNLTVEATVTSVVAKEANCSVMGDTQYKAVFSADWAETQYTVRTDIAIDADAHTWDNGVITKYPTYTETGVKTYTCQNTSEGAEEHTKTEDIPVIEAKEEETEKVEGPDNGKEYVLDIQDGILEPTSEAVKENYPTANDIIEAFDEKIEESKLDTEKGGSAIFEATVGYFNENDEFVPASEEFFEDGRTLKITLPYPEGADKNDKFEIYHLNSKTGEIEIYSTEKTGFYGIERTDKGLVIEVNSLSPFAIAYESVGNTPSWPSNPGKPSKPSNKPNPGITIITPEDEKEEANPNTGAPVVCSFDLTAAGVVVLAATAAVLEIKRRK